MHHNIIVGNPGQSTQEAPAYNVLNLFQQLLHYRLIHLTFEKEISNTMKEKWDNLDSGTNALCKLRKQQVQK